MAALLIEDLNISYGNVNAVKNLTLSAHPGEVLVILGSNGAGKTSTIECAQGLRPPTAGSVRLLGLDPRANRAELMPRIGVMLQDGGLAPSARPAELLNYYQQLFDRKRDLKALTRLGLEDQANVNIRRLSGGEKQRLSLALALVSQPEVLFLDEPTSGVDAHGRSLIREIVEEQRARGTAVVLTTHELSEAERMASRVAVLHHGELQAIGTLDELLSESGTIKFRVAPGLDLSALGETLNCQVNDLTNGLYELDIQRTASSLAAMTAWLAANQIELEELLAKRENLEDLFLRLTGVSA